MAILPAIAQAVFTMKVAVYDTKSYDRRFLQKAGTEQIEWIFHEFRLSASTASSAEGADAVCAFVNDKLDAACLKILSEQGINHVALRCAGFNNVDLEAGKSLGINFTRVPAYSPHAVAEHSLALLLTLNRKIHRAYNRVREQNFSLGGLVGFDLHGKTVGIIGTGKIGQVAATIFKGFGCRVLAYDKFPSNDWADKTGVEYVDLDTLLSLSNIISLYVPLNKETHYLINRDRLSLTRPGLFLVNTSRGKLIDTTALIEGLKTGHIGGVALDVYEEEEGVFFEDLSDTVIHDDELIRLINFPNVLVTAHQAFLTDEALSEIARVSVDNLLRLHRGESSDCLIS
jgi:D-lactate dehydrogenase